MSLFKKDPGLKSLSNLKSSERRKLYAAICSQYGLSEETLASDGVASLVLPPEVKYAAFKSPHAQGTLYTDLEGVPIWFRTRDSELLPTLFTMWKYPYIVPIVNTHQYVIERLINGSNLMLPGTIPPFPDNAKRGKVVAVGDYKKPNVAVAIGYCQMDLDGVTDVVGTHGVAVEIMHVYQDWLFTLVKGAKLPDKVDVLPTKAPALEHQPEEETVEQATQEIKEISISSSLTVEDMDDLFLRATLYSISQDTIETPISASLFMSGHVYKNFPPVDSTLINIKKTSWKKTAKYLKAMEKENLLKLKGKGDDVVVVSVNKEHEKVRKFEPYRIRKNKSGEASKKTTDSTELQVVQLYKAHSSASNFLRLSGSSQDYYTLQDIKALVSKYIQTHQLVSKNDPKSITADEPLQRLLKTATIERAKVVDVLVKQHFSPFYRVSRGDESTKPKKGQVPIVKIVEEMKIGRKIITKIIGTEEFLIDPEELSSILKVKCSGSTTVANNVQNPKLVEVTVQGPHFKTVEDLLIKRYGLKPTWIEYENKLKKKR
ncbi:hypothetical protein KL928_003619 [Ogataea angusta]|uniref:Eukaryotic translation initiation factor 2D n=1 Tax=Pichia angusta TaxID=870730 RepID=A0AAN6I4H0_PICAN|nr:uncharacterized protein KL928_003619 [Ogataea angusta]KAG7817720.1 hypothetical protein KL928_003619 [Ogataea angusta]